MYVQMPDPWRYVEGALPEHRDDVHVLRPPLDPGDALIRRAKDPAAAPGDRGTCIAAELPNGLGVERMMIESGPRDPLGAG